jgi:hypothetical protein
MCARDTQKRLKGLARMTNSRFNGWRMKDVWLDRQRHKNGKGDL